MILANITEIANEVNFQKLLNINDAPNFVFILNLLNVFWYLLWSSFTLTSTIPDIKSIALYLNDLKAIKMIKIVIVNKGINKLIINVIGLNDNVSIGTVQ
ncbi:Hypothetical protein MCYN_0878 [Mycoplasmopsis cynos C142]|uniref:Uncharacterized protein n=1 Tax=Mycoplasmopsis cynos (strain C142) TaxID=1246955 RepID=L0RYR2_MYCC1|nr:Hypothetical protein MCYN_0878 [Mycoplasmopsis cynos C142]